MISLIFLATKTGEVLKLRSCVDSTLYEKREQLCPKEPKYEEEGKILNPCRLQGLQQASDVAANITQIHTLLLSSLELIVIYLDDIQSW